MPKYWEREVRYGDLAREIEELEEALAAFAFPDVKQDWTLFQKAFPMHSDMQCITPLLKVCAHY